MDTIIEVTPNDLYITGYVIDFPEDGEALLLRDKLDIVPDVDDRHYIFRRGDKLRLIAYDHYRDNTPHAEQLWWVIADANNIFNPYDFDALVGMDLLIPAYNKIKAIT